MFRNGLLAFSALMLASPLHASSLEEFYKFFNSGQYPKAIESLSHSNEAGKSYFLGLSYSRMQEYDKAVIQFQQAINEKNTSQDLYYEYGQALYASNEL